MAQRDSGPRDASPAPVAGSRAAAAWARPAVAAVVSELATYPLDLLRTRLQLARAAAAGAPPLPRGLLAAARHVASAEGAGALFRGAGVSVVRQLCNAGVSVGAYPHVRSLLSGGGRGGDDTPLRARVGAGALTGVAAQALAHPLDTLKTRLQAERRSLPSVGGPSGSGGVGRGGGSSGGGALAVARAIYASGGAAAFYAALPSSLTRAAVINGVGISTYDVAKRALQARAGADDGLGPVLGASVASGAASALVATPLDVVKTRIMLAPAGAYAGALDCAVKVAAAEGARALTRGFVPVLQRQWLFNVVFWLVLEGWGVAAEGKARAV